MLTKRWPHNDLSKPFIFFPRQTKWKLFSFPSDFSSSARIALRLSNSCDFILHLDSDISTLLGDNHKIISANYKGNLFH